MKHCREESQDWVDMHLIAELLWAGGFSLLLLRWRVAAGGAGRAATRSTPIEFFRFHSTNANAIIM
jgi:hypothetical protein